MGLASKVMIYAAMVVLGLVLWIAGLGLVLGAEGPHPESTAEALLGLVMMAVGFLLLVGALINAVYDATKDYADKRPHRYPYY